MSWRRLPYGHNVPSQHIYTYLIVNVSSDLLGSGLGRIRRDAGFFAPAKVGKIRELEKVDSNLVQFVKDQRKPHRAFPDLALRGRGRVLQDPEMRSSRRKKMRRYETPALAGLAEIAQLLRAVRVRVAKNAAGDSASKMLSASLRPAISFSRRVLRSSYLKFVHLLGDPISTPTC